MLGELDHRPGQQLQRPARAARGRVGAGGRHQQRLLLARELAFRAGPWLFAERGFQVVFDKAALGPVHRRSADGNADGDVFIAGAGIGRQENLRPLELARGMLAAAQQSGEFVALVLAQLHSVTYIHRCPPVEGTTDESDAWAMSPRFPTPLHAQAGAIPGLHPRLHASAWPAAGRSRSATILSGDAAFSPPNGAHARTLRAYPTPTWNSPKHRGPGRSRSASALARQPRSTRQILCAEVLAALYAAPQVSQKWTPSGSVKIAHPSPPCVMTRLVGVGRST